MVDGKLYAFGFETKTCVIFQFFQEGCSGELFGSK
jgi:hypothetical protein